jgi:hypothetical protein
MTLSLCRSGQFHIRMGWIYPVFIHYYVSASQLHPICMDRNAGNVLYEFNTHSIVNPGEK